MSPISALPPSDDLRALAEDVRRLFDDLVARRPGRRHVVAGECVPLLDVFETERSVEVVLDVPGVAADALRVVFKAGVLLIVGEKERAEPSKAAPASFHVVERDFGRFARAVRVNAAIDAASAQARLTDGELRVVLPRREERRGHGIQIAVTSGMAAASA